MLIEIDFSMLYRLEVEDELHRRSWRWFNVKLAGLLASRDSLLAAHFRPKHEEQMPEEVP